jgi:hypothetical protein
MKMTAALVASFLLALGAVGCVGAPVVPPLGVIYTDLDAPLTLGGGDFGSRRGESSVECFLGLISTGDAGVRAAAKNGGISQVKRVDYEFYNLLGIYQRYTTVAYGN